MLPGNGVSVCPGVDPRSNQVDYKDEATAFGIRGKFLFRTWASGFLPAGSGSTDPPYEGLTA